MTSDPAFPNAAQPAPPVPALVIFRRERHESAMEALRDDIAGAIAIGHSGGAMEKDARDRLLGALDLSHRTVDEIMRHRRQIEMIDADLPPVRSSPASWPRPTPACRSIATATTPSWA
jgi:hypothetical protein